MNDLLMKLVRGQPVTDADLAEELTDVCEMQHASCSRGCPVYDANGGKVPMNGEDDPDLANCRCFKDGRAMLDFLRSAA